MDQIYKTDPKTDPNVSEKINIKSHMTQFSQRARDFETKMLNLKLKNVASGQSLELSAFSKGFDQKDQLVVAPSDVQILKSKPKIFVKPTFPPDAIKDLNLKSVEAAKTRHDRIEILRKNRKFGRDQVRQQAVSHAPLKYRGIRWLEDGKSDEPSTDSGPALKTNEDFSVYIRVYHPFQHVKGSRFSGRPKLCQEVVMYGTQTLAQLRGMIMCNADMAVAKDMSENPREPIIERAIDVCKSGFIFINNIFYNDGRDPSNVDYSAVIRKWAAEQGIAPLKTGSMENTRLEDLELQLGYPYVYQHQGDCEHLIVFSDIRLLAHDDALQAKNYPYVRCLPQRRARICMVCGKFIAKWVTEGSDRVPVDPCYFCEGCFYSFNYVDGVKVGQFKAFPYVDRSILI